MIIITRGRVLRHLATLPAFPYSIRWRRSRNLDAIASTFLVRGVLEGRALSYLCLSVAIRYLPVRDDIVLILVVLSYSSSQYHIDGGRIDFGSPLHGEAFSCHSRNGRDWTVCQSVCTLGLTSVDAYILISSIWSTSSQGHLPRQ